MSWPRGEDHGVATRPQGIDERQRLIYRCRRVENGGMREDPHDAAQYEIGKPERLGGGGSTAEPRSVLRMPRRIFAKCVNEDTHIGEDHCPRRRSITSSNA